MSGHELPMVVSWRRRCPALAVAAPLWLFGCGATVYPPAVAAPSQVGVLDHGQHSSLIVALARPEDCPRLQATTIRSRKNARILAAIAIRAAALAAASRGNIFRL